MQLCNYHSTGNYADGYRKKSVLVSKVYYFEKMMICSNITFCFFKIMMQLYKIDPEEKKLFYNVPL